MNDLRSVEPRNLIFSAEAATCRDCALALMADPPFSVVRPIYIHHDEAITRDATSRERLGIILVSDSDGKQDSKSH